MPTGLPRNGGAGLIAALLVCGVCACRPATNDASAPAAVNDASTAIPPALKASADAWNNADLAGHVRPYADSATFMGGNGPIQGRDRVSESLARSFWRDGKPRQQLSFDRVTVRPLGESHALSTGHFVLTGGGEADRSGWFSLTWEKTAAGWQIVHDHSS
jgi:ketosteroid isomerase-like protein